MELLVAWLPESDVSVVDVGLRPCMCWLNWSGSERGRVTLVNVRVVRRLVGGEDNMCDVITVGAGEWTLVSGCW